LAEKEALKELQSFRNIPLFTTGITAFWVGGYTDRSNQLRFTSTDAQKIQLYLTFLERFCELTRTDLRLALFIHADQNEAKCKRYWSRKTGIRSFHKTQVVSGSTKQQCVSHGTAAVVVTNSYVVKKMCTWIDHLPEMVLNTVPQKKKRL